MATRQAATKSTALVPIEAALGRSTSARFRHGQVINLDWAAERRYVLALLSDPNNAYLLECAMANPASVADAMLDLSRLGLSLSPTLKQAYLIPYKNKGVAKVTLAPSYIGMEQAVLRSGKVALIQTDLVFENDTFKRWTDRDGANFMHTPARKERGVFEGAYCLAKFANGESHLEWMPASDIEACHAAATRKNGDKESPAWKYFLPEMRKKCVTRRGAKHWPSDKHIELLMAQIDKVDPMDFGGPVDDDPVAGGELCLSAGQVADMEALLPAVAESSRGVWVACTAEAMGFPGGALTVPESQHEAMKERMLARYNKIYGQQEAGNGQG